jgi:hypothetical protein
MPLSHDPWVFPWLHPKCNILRDFTGHGFKAFNVNHSLLREFEDGIFLKFTQKFVNATFY